jgi:hypothetical protein
MSRTFTDDLGVQWEVREIHHATMPESLAKLLGPDRRRSGWLTFHSDSGERRRLSPYPSDWATVSEFEILHWCLRAVPIPPAPERRKQD